MPVHYKHTQTGYLMISVLAAALIGIGIMLAKSEINAIAIVVAVIVALALWLFSSLTVTIDDSKLEVRYGPGLIRIPFKLGEIESYQSVKNQWYYGWGIRLTPHGMLYNVSGLQAVEIRMKSGKKYRIGTDVPQELEGAIQQAIATAR